MSASFDLSSGRRLSYDGALCTVRCRGVTIPGTKGEWIGVEWDDTSRGKHNGTHNGIQYFECKSSHPTAASFIRPNRPRDPERRLLEAIRSKYVADFSRQTNNDLVTISGKVAEEIGFEKIMQQQSTLTNLRVAVLDFMVVSGIASRSASLESVSRARDELSLTCPNIVELDLSYNPIENWSDIEEICAALPKLRVLRLNVRLQDLSGSLDSQHRGCFQALSELHLNECLFNPAEIIHILQGPSGTRYPALQSLWLSQNELTNFDLPKSMAPSPFASIRSLTLENNSFTSLDPLPSIFSIFPNASSITLQSNHISTFGNTLALSKHTYSGLDTLNVAQNNITSFEFVDQISRCFPELRSLRISKNPVYETQQTPSLSIKQTETSYYLTLARLPKLKTLNYAVITTRDREEGEIYYLSIAEKDIRTTFNSSPNKQHAITDFQHKYPRYEYLCTKHDRDNLIQQLAAATSPHQTSLFSTPTEPVYQPGSLAARLITITFYTPGTPHAQFTQDIPKTITTSSVFALVSRKLGLTPLSFTLVYESEELDPVRDDLTTRSQIHGDRARGNARERWDEWGDWDADELVERSEREDGEGDEKVEGAWRDGVLVRDGRKWRRREVLVLFSMRPWGDWLEDGVRKCRVRVEAVGRKKIEN